MQMWELLTVMDLILVRRASTSMSLTFVLQSLLIPSQILGEQQLSNSLLFSSVVVTCCDNLYNSQSSSNMFQVAAVASSVISGLSIFFLLEPLAYSSSSWKKMNRPEITEETMAATWNVFEDDWE